MRILLFVLLFSFSCTSPQPDQRSMAQTASATVQIPVSSYIELKESIITNRKMLHAKYHSLAALNSRAAKEELSNFWVNNISNEFFNKWANTAWDFNGTTEQPGQGAIACGYFVTTILRDMDCKINRNKLAICASSQMMKALTATQKIKNLSYLSHQSFDEKIRQLGKGVYIIGLDFHTGFIVNDGIENWFIHSYYVKRVGVIKEKLIDSRALRSSKTKWMVSLTNDKDFLFKWLKG